MENLIQKQSQPSNLFHDLLIARGFTESEGYFVKDDVEFPVLHKFFVGETQELGTYLEYYQNRRMVVSGYWHDEKDFESNFEKRPQ